MSLILALVFGIAFGFIMQRVGAFEYKNILNALRLKDLTIPKFMFLTVAVTAVGLFSLRSLGLASLQLIAANPVADIAGGVIFGVGFALAGYCPGTSIGAMAEGKRDAQYTILGGIFGVLAYALWQSGITQLLSPYNWGNVTLVDYIPLNPVLTAAFFSLVLALAIYLVDNWENSRSLGIMDSRRMPTGSIRQSKSSKNATAV